MEIVSSFGGAQVLGPGVHGPCVGEDSRDRTETIALDGFSHILCHLMTETALMPRASPPGPQSSLVFCPNRQNIPFNRDIGIPAEGLVYLVGHKTGMLDF